MYSIHYDNSMPDGDRRRRVYDGDLFVIPPSPETLDYVAFIRSMVEEAFGDLDPETAQYHMEVEDFAALLSDLKPRFIHHPDSKMHLTRILKSLGCDESQTYFDVPRLRTSTSDDYLTTGIAFAFHPHRDTWYSAPLCQLNWWMPIYPLETENCLAFHPQYWRHGVKNGSASYDYQEWVRTSRFNAANQIGNDTRKQPTPEEPVDLEPQIKLMVPVGGIILFSGSQLHSSVPNTSGKTRFSIDFRTVHLQDAIDEMGAPNVDVRCTGTTMGDYLSITDLSHIPDSVIEQYLPGHPQPVLAEPAPSPFG